MKEIVYIYTCSSYLVMMITGYICVAQLELNYNFIYDLLVAYTTSFIFIVIYYFLHLWFSRDLNWKIGILLVAHYILYLISIIVTFIYYENIDSDPIHIFIVIFAVDTFYIVIHAKYFWEFLTTPQIYYQPMIINQLIKQIPPGEPFTV